MAVLAIPSGIYGAEIKAFFKVPPQRLGNWFLKARLGASEMKLIRIKRMRIEPSYLILFLFWPTIALVSLILIVVLAIYLFLTDPRAWVSGNVHLHPLNVTFLIEFVNYPVMVVLSYTVFQLQAAFQDDQSTKKLEVKIESLRRRIVS
ncbi:MAG TPA: hypothetical protein VMU57_06550 [Edaphobacter sp.]|uniref:hypothetical protein n=1 Tax=Edaphobacter sp. TaxID=1934404 RepID=UPI002CB3A0F6|nr:hypothetical protein [Edaphobacter sp.]HUZ94557.1 hypothetical protein [Edaphobacter sp.]